MTVDRDPQVGDVFRWQGWGRPNGPSTRTVVAVTERSVFYTAEHITDGVVPRHLWAERAALVPPRPEIQEWGVLYASGQIITTNQWHARRNAIHGRLIRIVNGVVCDEHAVPLERL